MEIILLLLLVGVVLAFVIPSFLNSRREKTVTQTPRQTGRTPVQRTGGGPSARDRVLARRRNALIGLVVAVIATLVAAIVTGSVVLLVVTLLADVAFAGYIAMLLQIKQNAGGPANRHGRWEDTQQVRVVSH